jgi:hypothetical protein
MHYVAAVLNSWSSIKIYCPLPVENVVYIMHGKGTIFTATQHSIVDHITSLGRHQVQRPRDNIKPPSYGSLLPWKAIPTGCVLYACGGSKMLSHETLLTKMWWHWLHLCWVAEILWLSATHTWVCHLQKSVGGVCLWPGYETECSSKQSLRYHHLCHWDVHGRKAVR